MSHNSTNFTIMQNALHESVAELNLERPGILLDKISQTIYEGYRVGLEEGRQRAKDEFLKYLESMKT